MKNKAVHTTNYRRLFYLSFLITAIAFAGCMNRKPKEYTKISGFTQGTTYGIVYYDSKNRDFSGSIDTILLRIDTSMSVYNSKSIINAFNSSSSGITVDTLLAEVVQQSKQIFIETGGKFDITVGSLVKAWGFHSKRGEIPSDEEVKRLLANIGSDKILLNELFLSKVNPDVSIDVNAIAQGFTVDLIAELFESKGVVDFLIEVGGEIRASGKSSRGTGWIVGIDKPVDDALPGDDLQVKITLTDFALATSGNYRKYYVKNGVRYSHTIDSQTGYPVTHSLMSATVVDKTAARADALATAFMVMGAEKAQEWLSKNQGVEAYLVYIDLMDNYTVWMTDGMKKFIVE